MAPGAQVLVYPAPEVNPPPLPAGEPRAGHGQAGMARTTGEFDGVRAWQRGDPMKLVVWKKFAKTGELVSRDAQQAQRFELWLDFAHRAGPVDAEERASPPHRLGAGRRRAEPGLGPAPARPGDRAGQRRTGCGVWKPWQQHEGTP